MMSCYGLPLLVKHLSLYIKLECTFLSHVTSPLPFSLSFEPSVCDLFLFALLHLTSPQSCGVTLYHSFFCSFSPGYFSPRVSGSHSGLTVIQCVNVCFCVHVCSSKGAGGFEFIFSREITNTFPVLTLWKSLIMLSNLQLFVSSTVFYISYPKSIQDELQIACYNLLDFTNMFMHDVESLMQHKNDIDSTLFIKT